MKFRKDACRGVGRFVRRKEMSKRTGLGRGLGAFFGNDYENAEAGKSSAKPSDEAGKKTSVRETKQEIEKKSLEELDMVLPGSKKQKKSASAGKTAAKTVGKGSRVGVAKASGKTTAEGKTRTAGETATKSKTQTAKAEPVVKIVEVEKEKFLNISEIEPNVSQPRKMFDEEQLGELAESIRRYGVLQPLLVQKKGDRYELIAGERRWRAAKLAGFREVPVIVREYTRQQTMEIALIENVQRADLNPIEEAKAYQMLIQEFGLRQEDVAERVAKNRATITNSMRLLKLDERVQEMLIQDRLTGGHARALLSLEDGEKQYQLALKTVENHLSVREVERLVKELLKPKKAKKKADPERDMEVFFKDVEEKLKGVMGTKVSINRKDKNKGNENEALEQYDDENTDGEEEDRSGLRKTEAAAIDPDGYMAFKMPWSLSLSYSYSISEDKSKEINKKTMRYPYAVSHSLNVSGNIKLGSRWNINCSSGYDFNTKEMSMTTVNISRDLHCFNMSCGLVFGPFTSYNFSIRAASNLLTDALKWDQRSNTGSSVTWY